MTSVAQNLKIGFAVNDFSKMHGGSFPPHTLGHQHGREFDGIVPGFNNDGSYPGTEGARKLLAILHGLPDSVKKEIRTVLVSYHSSGRFAQEVERQKAAGSKMALLIQNDLNGKHKNHFHIGFKAKPGEDTP